MTYANLMFLRSKYFKLKEPRKIYMLSPDGRNRKHNIKMDSLSDASFKPIYQPSLFMRYISDRNLKRPGQLNSCRIVAYFEVVSRNQQACQRRDTNSGAYGVKRMNEKMQINVDDLKCCCMKWQVSAEEGGV